MRTLICFLSGVLLMPGAATDDSRLRTRLTGGSVGGMTPSGHVDFRVRPSRGNEASFSVEVEDINLPAGTVLEVQINGRAVGRLTVSAAPVRGGELELESRDGDATPQLRPGDVVTVRGTNGMVLSGAIQTRPLDDIVRNPPSQAAPAASSPGAASGSVDTSRLQTGLAGGAIAGLTPSGHIDFRQRGSDLQLTVEVEDVNLPAGTLLEVEVDGRVVGQIRVNGVGRGGELELNTRDGALVQQLRSGALVTVRAPGLGAVLSGVAQPVAGVVPSTNSSGSATASGTPAADSARLRSGLVGGAVNGLQPSGHIDFRTQAGRPDARLNVEVEDVNLPVGTVLSVEVDGRVVGQITLNALRGGELELNSRDGAIVDQVRAGATVVVRAPGRGAILSGVAQTRTIDTPAIQPSGAQAVAPPAGSAAPGSNGNSGSGNSGSSNSGSGSGSGNSGSGSSGSSNSGSGSGSGNSGSGNSGSSNSGSGSGSGNSGSGNSGSSNTGSGSGIGNSGSGSSVSVRPTPVEPRRQSC